MPAVEEIARKIQAIGFRCSRCGDCCRDGESGTVRVLVGPAEIRRISAASGLGWDDLAEPYPEWIEVGGGAYFTFAWGLRRRGGEGSLLTPQGCSVYADRPRICRTYPFMLDGENLIASECPGLGTPIPWEDAVSIARDLLERKQQEEEEDVRMLAAFACTPLPRGKRVVIDSEGMKEQ